MDRGELLKYEFTILPGQNGSFVIRSGGGFDRHSPGYTFGFSSADDLIDFLSDERDAVRDRGPQPPIAEGDKASDVSEPVNS